MYTVRRPISTDRDLLREGTIVSRHATLTGARRALARQQRGAHKQGGFSMDYIWDETASLEMRAMED